MRDIATAKPVTAGTWFQDTIGEIDIKRVIAVSTKAHGLTCGLKFVLETRNPLQFLSAFLLELEDLMNQVSCWSAKAI